MPTSIYQLGRETPLLSRWNDLLRKHPRVAAAFLTLFTVIVYAGALRNSFVYDDEPQIIANPFILNPHLWTRIFTGSVWSFMTADNIRDFYRPLQMFFYWLIYRLAGPNPGVFHLVQVLIYAATGWLVYRLGCEIFEHESAAFLGAGFWILHPLHVEAVAWIAGMPDVGAGFFYLLAFLLFIRAEKRQQPGMVPHVIAACVYLPALFFKEMALSFPLLLLAYWFFYLPQSSRSAEWKARMLRWVPYAVAVAIYLVIRLQAVGAFGRTRSLWTLSPRVGVAALALLGRHAQIFVWPVGLNPFRPFNIGSTFASPWPWITLLVLIAAVGLRKRDAPLSFLIAWWAATLVPCLDIRQLSIPQVADRFSYLPSVGLCLAISLLLLIRLPAYGVGQWPARMAAPAVAVLIVFWGALTVLDIPHWRDRQSLMDHGGTQSPEAPYPHVVKADILRFQKGDLDEAEREYQTALNLNQRATVKLSQVAYDAYLGLGTVAQQRGRDRQALDYYQQAADILPGFSSAYDFQGAYYFPRGDYATASRYFVRAVKANPQDVVAHIYLANCWMKLGRRREAVAEFHAARTVDPTLKQAYISEARALDALGDPAAAERVRASYHYR